MLRKIIQKMKSYTSLPHLADSSNTIKTWMDSNKLKMNSDDTEFILVGSQQQLRKGETSDININTDLIPRSRCIRHLGADLYELLTMIYRQCRTAMSNLQKLKLRMRSLTMEAAKVIALALDIVHLDNAYAS